MRGKVCSLARSRLWKKLFSQILRMGNNFVWVDCPFVCQLSDNLKFFQQNSSHLWRLEIGRNLVNVWTVWEKRKHPSIYRTVWECVNDRGNYIYVIRCTDPAESYESKWLLCSLLHKLRRIWGFLEWRLCQKYIQEVWIFRIQIWTPPFTEFYEKWRWPAPE